MPRYIAWLLACSLLLAPPLNAQQNATVEGTVVDESQGVLPGATVTATEINSGVQVVGIVETDGRYRLTNVAPGRYRIRIELAGFATTEIPDVELLVGQSVTIPRVVVKVATMEEMVTVTSQAPLVNTTSSQVTGNIDRRQMAELPLQGRNWQELSMMVKGVTANNITNTPGANDGQFQLNLDGQQITQRVAGSSFGQPKVSREAIAEFQIVTNMFDITQGRSTGMQVQAISRSGTNSTKGSTYGFFRSDKFNAADPVTGTVLPFQDQQTGFTLGGPVILNKMHYFGAYEYERTPLTAALAPTLLPDQSWQFPSKSINQNYLARVDYQMSGKDSFTVRSQHWSFGNPFAITSGTTHPSMAEQDHSYATNVITTWTHIISSNMTLQATGGINRFSWYNDAIPSNDQQFYNTPFFVPRLQFPSLTLGGQYNYPNHTWQDTYSGRAEFNWSVGKHETKFGAEFLRVDDTKVWDLNRRGTYVFNKTPSTAELEARFPAADWNNPSAWNITGLEPYLQEFDINFNPDYLVNTPRPTLALWFGDNWRPSSSLSVTLGVRYDADWGATSPPWVTPTVLLINNGQQSGDFGYKNGIRDLKNVGPRVGFAYNVGGKNDLVIRGGSGIYFSTPVSNATYSQQFYARSVAAVLLPDGQPGFMENPTRGNTAADYLSGRAPAPAQFVYPFDSHFKNPYGWQSSIGLQKQLGPTMGFDVDLTSLQEKRQTRNIDVNLFYDPVTGYNKDPIIYGRPNPTAGTVQVLDSGGQTENVLVSSSFTRRFKNNFQASVTYTRTLAKKDDTTNFGYLADNQFNPNADWARSTDFQRDTLRANGIVNLPWRLTLASSMFYGSGNYFNPTSSMKPYSKPGANRLNIGPPIVIPAAVLDRWDGPDVIATGTVWPRDGLKGLPLKKIDMRVTKRVKLASNLNVEFLAELFNVFNWKNYGSYTTQITSPNFGLPVADSGTSYIPREGQLGVRIEF
jgi:hypothetical protein